MQGEVNKYWSENKTKSLREASKNISNNTFFDSDKRWHLEVLVDVR
jgi:hypothetical protein